jgi:hypothetical protein
MYDAQQFEKFNFSPTELSRMLNAFNKNNVKVTFEDFEDFNKSLNEIYKPLFQSYCRNFRKYGHTAILYEHDMNLEKITTYHKMYKYYYIQYFEEKVVELFRHIVGSISTWMIEGASKDKKVFRTFDDEFAYTFDANTHKLEGYYFMLDKAFYPQDDEDIVQQMFSYFGYQEGNVQRYIRKQSHVFNIYYLGYNTLRKLNKVGVCYKRDMMYDEKVKSKYCNYKHLYAILDAYNEHDELQVQFEAKNPDYFGLEVNPTNRSKEDLPEYLDRLVDAGVFTVKQKDYILTNKKTEESTQSCVKFRWEDKDTFNAKWYNRVIY